MFKNNNKSQSPKTLVDVEPTTTTTTTIRTTPRTSSATTREIFRLNFQGINFFENNFNPKNSFEAFSNI